MYNGFFGCTVLVTGMVRENLTNSYSCYCICQNWRHHLVVETGALTMLQINWQEKLAMQFSVAPT